MHLAHIPRKTGSLTTASGRDRCVRERGARGAGGSALVPGDDPSSQNYWGRVDIRRRRSSSLQEAFAAVARVEGLARVGAATALVS